MTKRQKLQRLPVGNRAVLDMVVFVRGNAIIDLFE